MPPNTYRCGLPQTTSYQVTELSFTDVFANTTAVITLLDPDGSLTVALRLVPDYIPTVDFHVSDEHQVFKFQGAALLVAEMAVGDPHISLMFSAARSDVHSMPITAVTAA